MRGDKVKEIFGSHKAGTAVHARSVVLILLGWISAIMSVFIYPFIFGFLGVLSGVLASKYESSAGLPLVVASIVLMSVGLMFGSTILSYTMQIFNYVW